MSDTVIVDPVIQTVIVGLTITLAGACASFYLWFHGRQERYLLFWGAGWLMGTLRWSLHTLGENDFAWRVAETMLGAGFLSLIFLGALDLVPNRRFTLTQAAVALAIVTGAAIAWGFSIHRIVEVMYVMAGLGCAAIATCFVLSYRAYRLQGLAIAAAAYYIIGAGSIWGLYKYGIVWRNGVFPPLTNLFIILAFVAIALQRSWQREDESEQKLRGLFELSPLGIALTDMRGRYFDFNEAYRKICGYPAAELKALDFRKLTPAKYQADDARRWESLLRDGHYDAYEKEYIRKDGGIVPVRLSGTLITLRDGKQYVWSIVEDITKSRQAALAMARERTRLETILRTASNGIHILDSNELLVEANDAFLQMLGYGREAIGKLHVKDWDAQDDLEVIRKRHAAMVDARQTLEFETRHKRKDGTLIDVEISARSIEIEGQRYIYASSRDVTDRKRADAELSETRQRLQLALDASKIAVWDNDLRTGQVYLSEGWSEMLGMGKHATRTNMQALLGIVHPDDVHKALEASASVIKGNANLYSYEHRVRARDGDWLWIRSMGQVIERDAAGRAIRMAGTNVDITERKQAEHDLIHLNEQLEERVAGRTADLKLASEELETFSYAVAYDLRTPLRAIAAFSALVARENQDKLDAASFEHLQQIQAGGARMGQLIDDLLNMTRVSGHALERADCDLSDLANDAVLALARTHPALATRVAVQPGIRVNADPGLLSLLLQTLIGKAWQFAEAAGDAPIDVGETQRDNKITYFVRDNSGGFDSERSGKLFAPFQLSHGQDTFEGTEIGLLIVKRIVAKHGGEVWAESSEEEGATFYFTLI